MLKQQDNWQPLFERLEDAYKKFNVSTLIEVQHDIKASRDRVKQWQKQWQKQIKKYPGYLQEKRGSVK